MIFILVESLMNGTVTIANYTNGVSANDFNEAKNKVKESIIKRSMLKSYEIYIDMDDRLSYRINFKDHDMPLCGNINNEPLKMIE